MQPETKPGAESDFSRKYSSLPARSSRFFFLFGEINKDESDS
jgi:hypothetical protein